MSNNLENAKILIIGGVGFIGSFLAKEILKEPVKEVILYDNFQRGKIDNIEDSLKDPRCSVFPYGGDIREVDILDKAMEGVDYVFHLAAMWILHCKDFPKTAFEVNIAGTFNVLEACVKHKVKKLIYSSSSSVYGDAVQIPMKEDHPFNNKNFYGATKIAGEAMCTAYNDRYGLEVIGLRYMNVYGAGQDQHAVYSGVVPVVLNKIDRNDIASNEKLINLFIHMDKVLKDINFIKDDRPMISRKINYIFKKASLSEEEINILRGILSAIENHSQQNQ